MEKWAIIVLSIIGISWFVLNFVAFFLINNTLKREYRKFYPHPLVGIVKDINRDINFSTSERIFSYIVLFIWFIPITAEWFIAWVLWKLASIFVNLYLKTFVENSNSNQGQIESFNAKEAKIPKTLQDLYEKLPIQIEEDQFLKMYSMVEAELSLEYFPLTYIENLKLDENNKIKYSNFTYNVIRVISVFNNDNAEVKFKCFPKSLKVFEPGTNEVSIKYNYTPKTKVTLDSESSYPLAEYFNALMFGVLSEYYIQLGEFEKASDYTTLYKREISALSNLEKENK